METPHSVGIVSALWRFPVKSMGGEQLDRADLTTRGLLGDRAYALVDVETGKVASAKSVKLFPGLLQCRAAFVEPPRPGREVPPVRITLPDGRTVDSASADANRALSAHFRREIVLARGAPADFTIDQYHPDLEGIDPAGHRDTVVEQKLGSALFAEMGMPSPVPPNAFFDLFPLSVLSTATLARLAELRPQTRFDARRFRMNVIVDSSERGFPENAWIGQALAIGERVRIQIAMPDPRCVMTTLPQGDLPNDLDVLRTLTEHNRLQVAGAGPSPCAGVYATVAAAGEIRKDDRVALASAVGALS